MTLPAAVLLLPWKKIAGYGIAILVVLMLIVGAFWKGWDYGYEYGKNEIQQLWDRERAALGQVLAAAHARAREAESNLARLQAYITKDINEKVRSLTSQRDNLQRRLRMAEELAKQRAASEMSCSAGNPANGEASTGDPGAELPATIGETDVDEALRADVIRLHLVACYAKYDAVQSALDKLRQ